MGFRGGVKLTPPSVSWFSSTPAEIGLRHAKLILKFYQIKKNQAFFAGITRLPFKKNRKINKKEEINYKFVNIVFILQLNN